MPNTTNFNFPTPADTDLVKDGASAIRSLGNSIDTAFVDLKGGTTGQILSKASNTDLDYTWITNDVGDITNVGVTSPITGGGSSASVTIGIDDASTTQKGAVQLEDSTSSTSTTKAATPNSVKSAYDLANGAIAKSLVDAAGDLIYATANDTVARLALGTAGKVLTVNSGATAPEWATPSTANFEFSLINSGGTSLSGSSTTVSSISGKNTLWIYIDSASSSDGLDNAHRLTLNGTGAYHYQVLGFTNTSFASERGSGSFFIGVAPSNTGNVSTLIRIDNCNSTNPKFASWLSVGNASGTYSKMFNGMGRWTGNAAITSVTYAIDSGTWDAGTIYVYGA